MSEARQDAPRRLWGLWQQGRRPDVAEFVAGAGPLGPLDLAAVLHVDQRQRWAAGERLPAEHYLRAHPAVAADEEAALDLIYAEYLFRQEQGEEVAPEEYLRRFPQFAGQLRLQLDFGQALVNRDAPPSPANGRARTAPDDPVATKAGFPNPPMKGPPADGPRPSPPAEEPRTLPRGAVAPSLSADAQQKIEDICNRFESAWVKGLRPRIEDYLTEAAAPQRPVLLRELLPLDVGYRRAHGEAPTAGEYLARFPALESTWLTEAVAVPPAGESPEGRNGQPPLRRPRAHRIRCPHCHSPIQLIDERPQEVLCPGCGSSFRMQEAHGTASAPSMRLGKFQLLERVGRGAFGAVWRALDLELERVVALKIPHAGLTISSPELQHFLDEARKAAKLRHPGIVNIHEVTTLQGMPVIVSDFINGVTLKDLLEVRRPTFRQTARLIAEVADALHHAHVNGLVHRDVKPANIMVERGPEATAGPDGLGRPLVLDFGLALREEAQITMTIEGEIIGTPAYINPEQAAGRGHYADRRSDVFSLGVVFYEMLCGELPFRGSRLMLLDQVQHDDPRLPRRINERIPRDLETICSKAMAKLPAKRYQTADEFAADLRRFLAGEPIHARRANRMERLWRWCQRRPRDAALAGALIGMLLLLAGGSTAVAFWIEREREATENQRNRAEIHLGQTLEALKLLSAAAQEVTEDAPQMEDRQRELLEKALALRKKILEEEPSAVSRAELGQAYHQMGRILKNLGDADRAKEDFTRAIAEFEGLAASGDPDALNNAALNHNELAEMLRATVPADAPERYEMALRIQEDLRAKYPDRDAYVKELARTCNNYGIYLAHQSGPSGGPARAMEKFDEAIRLMTPLANEARPDFRSDLAQEYINRGDCQESAPAGVKEAISDYKEAIELLEGLTTVNPGKHDYRFRLGIANQDLGMALLIQAKRLEEAETRDQDAVDGKLNEAAAADRTAINLFTRLAEEFPKTPLYRKGLANSWDNLGAALYRGKLRDKAREPWQNAQAFFQQLIADQPDVLEYKSKAAENLNNLGLISLVCDHEPAAAEPLLARAVALESEAWEKSNHQNQEFLRLLCGQHYLHAHSQVDRGDYAAAAAEAKKLYALATCQDDEERTISTFNAAGILSLCMARVEKDPKLKEEKRRELEQAYSGLALTWFREVSEKGGSAKGIKSIWYDNGADFDPVRTHEDFKKLFEDWRRREKEPS